MDALGNPIGVHLTGGQACELDGADVLLPQLRARTVIADKGRFQQGPSNLMGSAQDNTMPCALLGLRLAPPPQETAC